MVQGQRSINLLNWSQPQEQLQFLRFRPQRSQIEEISHFSSADTLMAVTLSCVIWRFLYKWAVVSVYERNARQRSTNSTLLSVRWQWPSRRAPLADALKVKTRVAWQYNWSAAIQYHYIAVNDSWGSIKKCVKSWKYFLSSSQTDSPADCLLLNKSSKRIASGNYICSGGKNRTRRISSGFMRSEIDSWRCFWRR